MAGEFKIKTGLLLGSVPTQAVTNITDSSTFTSDSSTLASVNAIKGYVDGKIIDVDTSFGLYETKVNLDSSFGDVWTELDALDASIAAFEANDVTFDYVDGSIVTAVNAVDTSLVTYVDGKVTNVDTSFGLYETKTNLDSSFGTIWTELDNLDTSFGLYETKTNLDSSFGLYETKVNLDISFGSYETKVNLDTSLNAIDVRIDNVDASLDLYETKVNLDVSFGNISIDDLVDVSLGTTLADEDILQYNVDTSTWDNTPVEDATDYFALTSNIDSSLSDIYTEFNNIDTSFGLYETKVNLNVSFGNISIDDLVDVSLGTTLADENVLQYNVDTSTWDNAEVDYASNYFVLKTDVDSSLDLYETKTNIDSSLNDKANLNTVIDVKETTYILVAADNNHVIDASGTWTLTFPDNLDTGFQVTAVNAGVGVITLDASKLLTKDSAVTIVDQYAGISAVHKGNGIYYCWGGLT